MGNVDWPGYLVRMALYAEYVQLLRELLSDRCMDVDSMRIVIRMRPEELMISAEKIWPGITFLWVSTLEKQVLSTLVKFLLSDYSFQGDLPLRSVQGSSNRRSESYIELSEPCFPCVSSELCMLPSVGDDCSVSEDCSEVSSVFDCEISSICDSESSAASVDVKMSDRPQNLPADVPTADGQYGISSGDSAGLSSFVEYREPRQEISETLSGAEVPPEIPLSAAPPLHEAGPASQLPVRDIYQSPYIQYGMPPFFHPLPDPGTPEAPIFDGKNATEFVRRFEKMCKRRGMMDWKGLCENFPDYCERSIRVWIESLKTWEKEDWKGLKEELCRRFEDQDSEYQQFTRDALDRLVHEKRDGEEEVRRFIVDFASVSDVLLARGVTTELQRCELFLKGLPYEVRSKVIKKEKINFDRPSPLRPLSLEWVSRSVMKEMDARKDFEAAMRATSPSQSGQSSVSQTQGRDEKRSANWANNSAENPAIWQGSGSQRDDIRKSSYQVH